MKVQNKCKMPKKCVDNQPPWLNDVLVAWLQSTFDATAIGQNFTDLFYVGAMDYKAANNRPYPSCSKPLFQSKASCKSIDMKMIFNSYTNKTRFHRKSLRLASFWKWEVLELGNGQFFYKQVICQVRDKTWPDKETVWSDKTKQNETTKHKFRKKNQVKEQNLEFTEEL